MKKCTAVIIMISFFCIFTTACTNGSAKKQNLIQSKRRFAEFIEPQQKKDPNVIDLSEGPKLRYDANLGPKSLNFDIKIVDPYQFK